MDPWQALGIDPTRDVDAINRAYEAKREAVPLDAGETLALRELAQARDQALNWQGPLPVDPPARQSEMSFSDPMPKARSEPVTDHYRPPWLVWLMLPGLLVHAMRYIFYLRHR